MALDAKQIVVRNKVLILCYVAAVVPIVLWVLFVLQGVKDGNQNSYKREASNLRSRKGELEDFSRRIDEMNRADKDHPAPNPVYTEKHRIAYEALNKGLADQRQKLIEILKARDESLERWFDNATTQPTPGDMGDRIKTELENLKKKYGDFVVDPTTKNVLIWQETVVAGKQREIQKKWWIQDRVLNAVATGDGKAERMVLACEFPLPPPAPPTPPGQVATKPLTSTIPVKFAVLASMRNVPKLTRSLLAQDIVFKVTRIKTEGFGFTIAKNKPDGFAEPFFVNSGVPLPLYEQPIYIGTLTGADKMAADEEQILPEPRMKVTFELDAIDFDMEAIVPPAAPATPAPEEPK